MTRYLLILVIFGGSWHAMGRSAVLAESGEQRPPAASEPTIRAAIKTLPGFRAELIYAVPPEQGSWVSMCVDPQGRLIVSDQYGALYRVTPPLLTPSAQDTEEPLPPPAKIEKIYLDLGEAQGLLWAFESLYVMVNHGGQYASGLYRARDTDGDDQLDAVELLQALQAEGEHGCHAVLLGPDRQSLYVVCGNNSALPPLAQSRVPRVWDEDLLLPRVYGKGFMRDKPAPGGFICRLDPEGKNWQLIATGFRNPYDAAFNAEGELFTFDADMEWDMNTPWYRPTRICHVVSGAEFGWRNGSGKWPEDYPDSVPPVINVGPGSPTGVCFGYGARFPTKYQQALFVSDWSFGKLYAAHLRPRGATYDCDLEEFVIGTPLPLTDVVINPHDGALYFAIGGRRVQSGLYRVTYVGAQPAVPAEVPSGGGAARALRRELEAWHAGAPPEAVTRAWPYLRHEDKAVRYAARIALEHCPLEEWQQMALSAVDPQTSLEALLALVRKCPRSPVGEGGDMDPPPPDWDRAADDTSADLHAALRARVLAALNRLPWSQLSDAQQLHGLRVYALACLRLGRPTAQERAELITKFDPVFPTGNVRLNADLAQLLVYLQAPTAAAKTMALLEQAPTQEEQIELAKTLRHLRVGWTPPLREAYFRWFARAATYRGGASFALFVDYIRQQALAGLNSEERQQLEPLSVPASLPADAAQAPRPTVKHWQIGELLELVERRGLTQRDFQRGQRMFAAAQCFSCHRFDQRGGAVGPDLTALSGRFSVRDILEAIIEPHKVISDLYAAVTIETVDGRVITGRIVNFSEDGMMVNTDMLNPTAQVRVARGTVETMTPSTTSMMPEGLLNTLREDEVLDLLAYLLSGGDENHIMFARQCRRSPETIEGGNRRQLE